METELNYDLNWSLPKKIAFRFSFILFLLFIILENNGAYPFWEKVIKYPVELLHTIIPWIGKHVLNISYEIIVFSNGSGDTTYDYVKVFTIFMAAVFGTTVWSAWDRKRTDYTTLYYWLTVAIRFYVGLMLINYGLSKVIKLQFPSPNLFRLTQNYGDSSPMGLAWTFLGFSDGYNLFMGMAEVAAVLLLFRRTMTAGAIITLMTTANVMAVNYFYDVPVKILSTALVGMTLFLLLNDAPRLWKFFFTGQAVLLPVIKEPVIKKPWVRTAKFVFKFLVVGYAVIYGTIESWGYKKQYGDDAPKPKLYGLYNVDVFVKKNNDTESPLTNNDVRWKQIVIQREGYATVRFAGDSSIGFFTKLDTVSQRINFTLRTDTTVKCSFRYDLPGSDRFHLKGTIQGDSVSILTRKEVKDIRKLRLIKRGFHWINESPYNR